LKKVYGLTGGIASGKSTVSELLRARGAIVIDADQIAREVVAPGTPGLRAVAERFGAHFVVDGALDRAALGAHVFANVPERKALDAILHPLIAAESARQIGDALQADGDPVFYDAALLVENGLHRNFAGLVVVACSPETQLARIMRRDGLSEHEARLRLDAQLPLAEKVRIADHIIDNDGPLDALPPQIDRLLDELRSA
jgi:dephospho-CoA kinase